MVSKLNLELTIMASIASHLTLGTPWYWNYRWLATNVWDLYTVWKHKLHAWKSFSFQAKCFSYRANSWHWCFSDVVKASLWWCPGDGEPKVWPKVTFPFHISLQMGMKHGIVINLIFPLTEEITHMIIYLLHQNSCIFEHLHFCNWTLFPFVDLFPLWSMASALSEVPTCQKATPLLVFLEWIPFFSC